MRYALRRLSLVLVAVAGPTAVACGGGSNDSELLGRSVRGRDGSRFLHDPGELLSSAPDGGRGELQAARRAGGRSEVHRP